MGTKTFGFIINTDTVSNEGVNYGDVWLERGIGVTSGEESVYKPKLDRLLPNEPVFLYVSLVGIVAVGYPDARPATVVTADDEKVSPREPREYHRAVDWVIDLREAPIPHTMVMALRAKSKEKKPTAPQNAVEAVRLDFFNELMTRIRERTESLDIARMLRDQSPQSTQAWQWIEARRGQGRYRQELLDVWDGKCAVTGCEVGSVLRASHALAWRDADDKQRLDPNNGLPLVANLDALFDVGLISFDDDGQMICAAALGPDDRQLLGIPAPLRKPLNVAQKRYLKAHRNRFRLA